MIDRVEGKRRSPRFRSGTSFPATGVCRKTFSQVADGIAMALPGFDLVGMDVVVLGGPGVRVTEERAGNADMGGVFVSN
jgi:hypothetical protein